MAESDAAIADRTVRLQVAAARQEESGQGIARMPRSAFQALGITEGDVVEITGKRSTVAVAMPAYDEDQSLEVVRLDGLQRGNAEAASGEHVTITVAESQPAARVVFAPAQREMRLQGPDPGAEAQLLPQTRGGRRSCRNHRTAAGPEHAAASAAHVQRPRLRVDPDPP